MKYDEFILERNDNDLYPRLDFVVVKYDPMKYNDKGCYTDDNEWTCIEDAFRNNQWEDYMTKEDAYVNFFESVLKTKNCRRLVIHMWGGFNDLGRNSPLLNTAELFGKYKHLKDYSVVSVPVACDLLRLSLRSVLDCSLVNMSNGIEFLVGYEYYLHLRCRGLDYQVLEYLAHNTGLYLNPRQRVSSGDIKYDMLHIWLMGAKHGNAINPQVFDKEGESDYLYETLFLSDTVLNNCKPKLKAALYLPKPVGFRGNLSWDNVKSFENNVKLLVFQWRRKVIIDKDLLMIENYPLEWKEYRAKNGAYYIYL